MKKILIAAAIAMVATSASFGAVKASKIGLDFSMSSSLATLTTPSIANGPISTTTPSVGVWWHVTDMIALRPSISYSSSTTKTDITSPVSSSTSVTTNTFGVGLSVPIYLAKMNLLDLYVAPGVAYGSNGSNYTNIGISASLGVQVAVNDQLHFFGEMGLGYNSTTNSAYTSGVATGSQTTSGFGTARGAVGVLFYFN